MASAAATFREAAEAAPRIHTSTGSKPPSNPKLRKRTKTGCLTCRKRRIKCGEERPVCKNCITSKRHCEGYNQRVIFKGPIGDWPNHPSTINTLSYHNSMLPGARPIYYQHPQPIQHQQKTPEFSAPIQFSSVEGDLIPGLKSLSTGHLLKSGCAQDHVSPTQILDEAAVEYHDDDYYDIQSDDEIEESPNQAVILERDFDTILRMSTCELNNRRYDAYFYQGAMDYYRAEWVANPLKNPKTARVFANFIFLTGPSLSLYERNPRNISSEPVPNLQKSLWTYTLPMMALNHQGLLHAMLALSSLQIAKLRGASTTPSLKHYAYALKRLHYCVGHPKKRHQVTTLAASLLLAFYEVMTADHLKWRSHLVGARQLLVEIDYRGMTKELKRIKAEQSAYKQSFPYQNPDMLMQQRQLNHRFKDSTMLPDEGLVSTLIGKLRYDKAGRVIKDFEDFKPSNPIPQGLDLSNYELFQDLYWWYCRQDAFQSIISGNQLLMDYSRWSDCPPRAPIGRADAIYGTHDHVILILGRIADFAARDRERKIKVVEANGGQWRPTPGMPTSQPPQPGKMGPDPSPTTMGPMGPSPDTPIDPPPDWAGGLPLGFGMGAPQGFPMGAPLGSSGYIPQTSPTGGLSPFIPHTVGPQGQPLLNTPADHSQMLPQGPPSSGTPQMPSFYGMAPTRTPTAKPSSYAQACLTCREMKIKCKPAIPKCHQCTKSQRVCEGGLNQPSLSNTVNESSSFSTSSPFKSPNPQSPVQASPTSPSRHSLDIEAAYKAALEDWSQICSALYALEQHLGSAFQPLSAEYFQPLQTPFGDARQYRSYDIGIIWALLYMAHIITIRSHPSMPPAAIIAAGMAAPQTAHYVNEIGRIAAGIVPTSANAPLSPSLRAALIESTMPLFFAGVQYHDAAQRAWLVSRSLDIEARTGWASAGLIARGCEMAWKNAGEAGRGPPYRSRHILMNMDDRISGNAVRDPGAELPKEMSDRWFIVTNPETRVHWAIGLLNVEEEFWGVKGRLLGQELAPLWKEGEGRPAAKAQARSKLDANASNSCSHEGVPRERCSNCIPLNKERASSPVDTSTTIKPNVYRNYEPQAEECIKLLKSAEANEANLAANSHAIDSHLSSNLPVNDFPLFSGQHNPITPKVEELNEQMTIKTSDPLQKTEKHEYQAGASRLMDAAKFSGRHGENETAVPDGSSTYDETSPTRNSYDGLDSDCEPSSPGSSSVEISCSADGEGLLAQLTLKKRQLIDRLMDEFYSMFDSDSGVVTCVEPSSSASQQSTRSDQSVNTQQHDGSGTKRKSMGSESPPGGSAGDDSNKHPRRNYDVPGMDLDTTKKLACPYFKRNPRKYQRVRSCPGPGWDTVHRLKEHLYWRHALPIQCPRCYQHFKTDIALKDHHRALQGCEVREEEPTEGFNKQQEKMLRSRKRSSPCQSEEDRWRGVYRILFPDDIPSAIPSPYYNYDPACNQMNERSPDSAGFARYEEFLSRELPRRVRRRLELACDRELDPIEDRLKAQLVEIVRTCQEQLFCVYHQSLGTTAANISTVNELDATVAGPYISSPGSTGPSKQLSSSEVGEHSACFIGLPDSSLDTWFALDRHELVSGKSLENGQLSDSGYNSLDSMHQQQPSDHSFDVQGSSEWWNDLDPAMPNAFSSIPHDHEVFSAEEGEYF